MCLFTQRKPALRVGDLLTVSFFDNTSMVYSSHTSSSEGWAQSEDCENDESSLVYSDTAELYLTISRTQKRLIIIVTALAAMLSRLSSFLYTQLLHSWLTASTFRSK